MNTSLCYSILLGVMITLNCGCSLIVYRWEGRIENMAGSNLVELSGIGDSGFGLSYSNVMRIKKSRRMCLVFDVERGPRSVLFICFTKQPGDLWFGRQWQTIKMPIESKAQHAWILRKPYRKIDYEAYRESIESIAHNLANGKSVDDRDSYPDIWDERIRLTGQTRIKLGQLVPDEIIFNLKSAPLDNPHTERIRNFLMSTVNKDEVELNLHQVVASYTPKPVIIEGKMIGYKVRPRLIELP